MTNFFDLGPMHTTFLNALSTRVCSSPRAAELSTNGRPVRLKICTLIVYSILWVIATTWQASAVHVIKPFSFESVKKIEKKNLFL